MGNEFHIDRRTGRAFDDTPTGYSEACILRWFEHLTPRQVGHCIRIQVFPLSSGPGQCVSQAKCLKVSPGADGARALIGCPRGSASRLRRDRKESRPDAAPNDCDFPAHLTFLSPRVPCYPSSSRRQPCSVLAFFTLLAVRLLNLCIIRSTRQTASHSLSNMLRTTLQSSGGKLLRSACSCRRSFHTNNLQAPSLASRRHGFVAGRKPMALVHQRRSYAVAIEDTNKGVVSTIRLFVHIASY